MDILGDRKFVEVPGNGTHELPPLLVRMAPHVNRLDRVMGMANDLIEQEEIIPYNQPPALANAQAERRRMDLAVNLVEQYLAFVQHWQWGDSILEWIRQCEMTFDTRLELRNLLKNDVWPHAGRSSFVQLLADKAVDQKEDVHLENAVGLRLEDFLTYIDYIADRRLEGCGLAPLSSGIKNPLPWLAEMMDIKKEQNFFEGRVTEYQKASSLSVTSDDEL